ncbi:MAG: RlmE family RNA methyltransferase [Myxococcales bacterium]|nr:RlmE family RNA methyltransferase [Myxococcales bacterium]
MGQKKNPYARPDEFTKRAKAAGYPARSVFKLEEIDRRCRLFRPGMRVLDLGCAPGSWLMYAAQKVGGQGSVRGIDLTPLEIVMPRNAQSIAGDALSLEGPVRAFVDEGGPYDVVVSDMAPATTGNRFSDQARSAELVRGTLAVAERVLAPGGAWVAKIFMSEDLVSIRADVRRAFTEERVLRPEGVRKVSYEVFLVGLGKRAHVDDGGVGS